MTIQSSPSFLSLTETIRNRYERIEALVPHGALLEYVSHAAAAAVNTLPNGRHPASDFTLLIHLASYRPSFYKTHITPYLTQTGKQRKRQASRINELVAPLKRALLHCIAARLSYLIRPSKLPNGKLRWSSDGAELLLKGAAK